MLSALCQHFSSKNPNPKHADPSIPKRVIVYIDAFNLYFGLKSHRWERYLWLDPVRLSAAMLRRNQVLTAVRYFTARVTQPPDKVHRQSTYLDAIQSRGGLSIDFGKYRSTTRYCDACSAPHLIDDEKQTDVNIAVSMLVDASNDLFDIAFLVSGDSDLVGSVQAVQTQFAPKVVWMAFPPGRFHHQLEKVAAGRIRIREKMLADSQLPEVVTSASGYPLQRPQSWK